MLQRLILAAIAAAILLPATASAAVEPGVVIAKDTPDKVARAKDAGAKWVRMFANWSVLEPDSKGNYFNAALTGLRNDAMAYQNNGIKVLMVVLYTPNWARRPGSGPNSPPLNPADYGDFIAHMGTFMGDKIDAYEIWNEPDEKIHWENGPQPDVYSSLLKTAYPRVKQTDPTATVVTGGMVGNNFDFLAQLYKFGAKGSFDAVGVHTDTACLNKPPDFQYRDEQGRIGRFVFTSYREVQATMDDNGDGAREIWMTEMGWPTPMTGNDGSGSVAGCLFAGQPVPNKPAGEPGGVNYPTQAAYLKKGFECMQGDGIVDKALWFSLHDVDASTNHENRFGLIESDGTVKPSLGALKAWSDAPSSTTSCGEPVDRIAPTITAATPADGYRFAGPITVTASATDNLTVNKMELWVGNEKVGGAQAGAKLAFTPWDGAKNLPNGDHVLTIKAFDGAKNVGERKITVKKVRPDQLTPTAPAVLRFSAKKKPGRRVNLRARVTAPGSDIKPKGKIRIFLQIKRGRRFVTFSKYTKGLAKPVNMTVKLKKPGTWRIYARYAAQAPFKPLRSKYTTIRAR